jgi:hypothetical protein
MLGASLVPDSDSLPTIFTKYLELKFCLIDY